MTTQQTKALRAEKLPEAVSVRRTRRSALGRGLGTLLLHQGLRTAGLRARVLREPALPRGLPSWARTWARKVWRLGRKA